MSYGVPPFKLDRGAVGRLVTRLKAAGVAFELGTDVDEARLRRLAEEADALFLGTGAQVPRDVDLPGRHLAGVVGGVGWLAGVNAALLEKRDPPDLGGKTSWCWAAATPRWIARAVRSAWVLLR